MSRRDFLAAGALPAIALGRAALHCPLDDAVLAHERRRKAADRSPPSAAPSPAPTAVARVERRRTGVDVRGVPAPLQDLGAVLELVAVVGDPAHAAQQPGFGRTRHLAQLVIEDRLA